MSAKVESAPIRGSSFGTIVIAIIVALGVGALAGVAITKAVDDRPAAVATGAGAPLWDAQKLEAMEGRAMAEQYRVAQSIAWDQQKLDAMAGRVLYQPAPAIEGWDAQTLDAMAGRVLYEPAPATEGWDAYKLKAMEGRVLAAQVGAEDPPVRPHLPTNQPRG
jgi:hypothetical protein